jgi:hypothetical protein
MWHQDLSVLHTAIPEARAMDELPPQGFRFFPLKWHSRGKHLY